MEHRREIAGRGVDDLQDLGGRSLLLQCLARLGQEPRVLHRNNRLRREILQQCNLLIGEGENFLAMHDDRPEQRFVFSQRNHYPRADPARVDKLSKGVICAVGLFLGCVGHVDDLLAARDPAERPFGDQLGGTLLSHRVDELRVSTQRHGISVLALDPPYVAVSGLAQAQCLFEHRVEYRSEVAG
jgi:hypothetical protein